MAIRQLVPRRPEPHPDESVGHPLEWLVRLRPHTTTTYVSAGRTVLATSPDGFVFQHKDHGLWVWQTRTLSRYRWLINGKPPQSTGNSNVAQHAWLGYYIDAIPNCKETETHECNPTQQTLELRLSRFLGGGMHEEVSVTNHTQVTTSCRLELEVEADFVDRSEAGGPRKQHGRLSRRWKSHKRAWELTYDYRVRHRFKNQEGTGVKSMHRGLRLHIGHADSPPRYARNRISFQIKLAPHATWTACLTWIPSVEGRELPMQYACGTTFNRRENETDWDTKRRDFLSEATALSGPGSDTLTPVVLGAFDRARRDLAALRMYDLDDGNGGWVMAAGLPTYVALFGRDTLAASWEASLLATEPIRGTLAQLAKRQATGFDAWRDEQPGLLIHEEHTDPLAVLNFNPHGRYYGGVTGAIYFPVVVAALWHWTGDKDLVRRFIPTALKGLEWADKFGHPTGGPFYKYEKLSKKGEKNQGWKDSDDAIVYPDGSQVPDPLGTCEMQGFVYASKLHLSEVLWWLGRADEADRLFNEAEELKKRFNEHFWMDDEGCYGMAVDSDDRLVRSIGSDPGHCLASGIVAKSHAQRLVRRLMADDMFSGWGVRTLSARHPAYNPFAYHRGTVWPVENAVFVLAFARYGLHKEMWRLARCQFEAAALFDYYRPPEVFAGHTRDAEHPFPGLYPRANWPQAWSASSVVTMIQAMVGLYPYAPLNVLLLDPWLPDWLPDVSLEHLRVGKARVSLHFWRTRDGRTDFKVTKLEGKLHILRQPSPWSLTATSAERVKDAILSLLPGK